MHVPLRSSFCLTTSVLWFVVQRLRDDYSWLGATLELLTTSAPLLTSLAFASMACFSSREWTVPFNQSHHTVLKDGFLLRAELARVVSGMPRF